MHDATDNAPIVCTLDASHIRRQIRLNPLPLLIAQPKQVLPHGPDPPKRIRYIWNQDCFAAAAKLMSSHEYGPPTTIYNRFVLWARGGIWEKLFRELAGNGRSTDTQMIDSTHVKAHRSAAGGKGGRKSRLWPLARRAQHEDTRTRRC